MESIPVEKASGQGSGPGMEASSVEKMSGQGSGPGMEASSVEKTSGQGSGPGMEASSEEKASGQGSAGQGSVDDYETKHQKRQSSVYCNSYVVIIYYLYLCLHNLRAKELAYNVRKKRCPCG